MTPLIIGYIGVLVLVILLFSGIHIGVVMGMIGFLGIASISGWDSGFVVLKTVPFTTFANYGMSVVPLFILMGAFCFYSGISKELYDCVHKWLGQLRGGLAMATVGACALFAAVSGSSLATAATMGSVALPEMKRYRYDPALATGCIAAGGTMGILIPPSIPLVIYGILTSESIGKLLMAGIIPGILEAVFYIITIHILCLWRPSLGPPGPKSSLIEKVASLKAIWAVVVLFTLVIGGIYFGFFSPTEAAGVGSCGAFVFALVRKRLSWRNFQESLTSSIKTTAMIFAILLGAMILGYFFAVTRLPFELASFIGGLPVNRYVILILILIVYLILGCIMDSLAMILLTVPIFYPLIKTLGFDPIWFGIIVVRAMEIGMITPPVGMNVFIIKGIAQDVPMYTIFRGAVPFLIADLCHVTLLILVPQLATFLPGLMR
jgi:tripartite ATP-independent transporter DctM subunit